MAIDKFDWHYDDALKGYCERVKKAPKELTEDETDEVCEYASAHIGLFLKWVILHGFEGEEADKDDLELVRNGKYTGTDYLLDCCDGKFWDEDVSEKMQTVIEEFYSDYIDMFGEVLEALNKDCYGFIESESDYPAAEKLIDRVFEKYKDKVSD